MLKEKMPSGFEVFVTKKGWMTVDAFCHWLLHQFVPQLKSKDVPFPVVLYLDGHRSHINIRISDICTENDIVLICFPPNTTHLLQPCDVALFKPLKGLWKAKVHEWSGKAPLNKVTVKNMAHLLSEVWQDLSPKYGQNGFRACGLYPWNPDAVKISKCLSKDEECPESLGDNSGDSSSLQEDPSTQERSSSLLEHFPEGFPDFPQSRYTPNSEHQPPDSVPVVGINSTGLPLDCPELLLNPAYSGHVILAEFEKSISPVMIDSFINILKSEELGEVFDEVHQLSDMDRVKYSLWKDLIQRYFGKIRGFPAVARYRPSSKLDFGPLPTIPKSSRKRDPPSPILTGENAKKQLSDVERRRKQVGEKSARKGKTLSKTKAPQLDQEFDDDGDEGYLQYMEMNGHFQLESLPTQGSSKTKSQAGTISNLPKEALSLGPVSKEAKGRKKTEKIIIEGSRRSSRLQAKLKIVDFSDIDQPAAIVDGESQRQSLIVLCTLCKSTGTEDDSNQCRICDCWVHNACFHRDILKKHNIPSFCCPTCIDTFMKNRDNQETMARQ